MRQVLVVFACVLLAAGPAAADDSARNREGFWTVGRGDAKSEVCMASLSTKSGDIFMLRAVAGEVGFAVGAERPMRRGAKATIATEVYSFDFAPSFNDRRDMLYFDGSMNDRALAALRLARGLGVTVDGRTVLDANVEGTGLENALDAVIACSKGERGWWGPGVETPPIVATKENDPGAEPPLHKDGVWSLAAHGDGCAATVRMEAGGALVLLAENGGHDIMVGAGGGNPFKRGRKGRLETDAYALDFKPVYDGDDYMQLDAFLDGRSLLALRRAKSLRITVDGREEVNAIVEGTGLPEVITSLEACGRGEKGWWGEGAALP